MTNELKYFIGNWKMFGDFTDIKIIKAIERFINYSKETHGRKKIVFCVPSTLIYYFSKKLKTKHISLGVQNCHYHDGYGPFTGSLSAAMLKKAGASYIILGHSENRLEGESNILIKKKIISSLRQNLNIVFCVGETLQEKKRKKTFSIIKKQLRSSLNKNFNVNKILIAYEPVWSIGTNKIPNTIELSNTINFIKNECKKIFRNTKFPRVLYGGSVNTKNISLFSSISDINGFLVGGASQSSKKFIDIVKNYYK